MTDPRRPVMAPGVPKSPAIVAETGSRRGHDRMTKRQNDKPPRNPPTSPPASPASLVRSPSGQRPGDDAAEEARPPVRLAWQSVRCARLLEALLPTVLLGVISSVYSPALGALALLVYALVVFVVVHKCWAEDPFACKTLVSVSAKKAPCRVGV